MLIHRIVRRITTQASQRANRVLVGTHNSVTRLRSVLANLVSRVNGNHATAAAYLTSTLGADAEFVRRYGSVYGKAATKAYREQYGTDPARDGLAVVRRNGHPALVRVNTYPRAVLADAAAHCPRTAALIGA